MLFPLITIHPGRERTEIRKKFILAHLSMVRKYYEKEGIRFYISADLRKWINEVARKEIKYSAKTNDGDIWLSLSKTYKRIIQKNKLC